MPNKILEGFWEAVRLPVEKWCLRTPFFQPTGQQVNSLGIHRAINACGLWGKWQGVGENALFFD